jgi:acyl dehydratase
MSQQSAAQRVLADLQPTIAHGYLTLSLYPLLRGLVDADKPLYPGVTRVINDGLDKLRFPDAVKSGSRAPTACCSSSKQ